MIRPAEMGDLDWMVDLFQAANKSAHPEVSEFFDREEAARVLRCLMSRDDIAAVFVATDGTGVGFCAVSVNPPYYAPSAPIAVIAFLWVSENARGRGHGKGLLDEALAWCRCRGIKRVLAEAAIEQPTPAVLEKSGYKKASLVYEKGVE